MSGPRAARAAALVERTELKMLGLECFDRPPEGSKDKQGRWYPTPREEGADIIGRVRAPSTKWPWSYYNACKSARHMRVLVQRGLQGCEVPPDIYEYLARMRVLHYHGGEGSRP